MEWICIEHLLFMSDVWYDGNHVVVLTFIAWKHILCWLSMNAYFALTWMRIRESQLTCLSFLCLVHLFHWHNVLIYFPSSFYRSVSLLLQQSKETAYTQTRKRFSSPVMLAWQPWPVWWCQYSDRYLHLSARFQTSTAGVTWRTVAAAVDRIRICQFPQEHWFSLSLDF